MSPLTFTLRETPRQRVDLSPLTPERLAGKALAEIEALELTSGNCRLQVRELFEVSGTDAATLVIRGGCDRLDRIGQGMGSGSILVEGDAGAYLGLDLQGGAIEVRGDAGAYCASRMAGGLIHIHGNAGDFLGAALPGEPHGMRGGTVVVRGSAGDRAADRLRRGQVLIEGNAGRYCASRMIAGTVAVLGRVGEGVGSGMRRGTLLLSETPPLPSTFNESGTFELTFLPLLIGSWRGLPGAFATLAPAPRARRYVGDRAAGGLGEILIRA